MVETVKQGNGPSEAGASARNSPGVSSTGSVTAGNGPAARARSARASSNASKGSVLDAAAAVIASSSSSFQRSSLLQNFGDD